MGGGLGTQELLDVRMGVGFQLGVGFQMEYRLLLIILQMYQSQQLYAQQAPRTGCFGCFGSAGYQQMPQPYGYDQYQYGQYPGTALTTSIVTPVGVGVPPVAPPVGMVAPMGIPPNPVDGGIYTSRTIQAPPIYNKAVVAPPASSSRVEYVPYEVKQLVYDTVQKVEVIPIHKTITEYEQIKHIETIPVEKMVTDYYAMEYLTEFMPQTMTERVTDYVQQEVITQTVNYVPREMQRVIPAGQYPPPQVAPMVQMVPPPMQGATFVPPMQGPTFAQSVVAPIAPMAPIATSIPTVASVAPLDPSLHGSYVTPGLNVSQQMMTSAQFGYGYGMGPTVGTVVGRMNAPGYGITAVTN